MSRQLTNKLLDELYNQESSDPLLMLVAISNPAFSTLYLVNNTVDIVSRGNTYIALPLKITPSADDGESNRTAKLELDNVSLEVIDEFRTVTDTMEVTIEAVLGSDPDIVEIEIGQLIISNINYNANSIVADLLFDDFLRTKLTSEDYTPFIYPGLFS